MKERERWNQAAEYLQAGDDELCEDVFYGPFAPGEADLQLFGPLTGKSVLDLGCGGGQNVVALAKAGALVTGLDVSDRQIARARDLAARHGVSPELVCGDMHALDDLTATCYDLILATYVLPYSTEPARLAQAIYAHLKPGGRLAASLDHPIRSCFWDQVTGELEPFPVRGYHCRAPMGWHIGETPVDYHHRTVAEWVEIVRGAGLQLEALVEPELPAGLAMDYWPADSALAPLAHIPHTLILIANRDDTNHDDTNP